MQCGAFGVLTAIRKSPGCSPAKSATPPGSTSSRYCKPGQRSDGFNGDAALAPRNIKPNPRFARCNTTVRASCISLNQKKKPVCKQIFPKLMSISVGVGKKQFSCVMNNPTGWLVTYTFFDRGAVKLLYDCTLLIGCSCSSKCTVLRLL